MDLSSSDSDVQGQRVLIIVFMTRGRSPTLGPLTAEPSEVCVGKALTLSLPWGLAFPGSHIRQCGSVFFDFFIIYTQNGFFLEAPGS